MKCHYYEQKKCLSCLWINDSYPVQLDKKQSELIEKLTPFKPIDVMPPFASKESGFRNKAKMAVLGTVEKPVLGIQTDSGVVDLCDCPLYSHNMQNILKIVRTYIRKQGFVPYNVNKRKGELKFIVLTESATSENNGFMLRFVLNSQRYVEKIKHSIAQLQDKIHNLQVISVNIQPNHSAILEGEEEIILSDNSFLPITLNDIPLFIKPKSFFQTNTYIAEKLYKTASDWVTNKAIHSVWDLFCGVGGFGLHCVNFSHDESTTQLIGIEINPDAIECATKSAQQLDFKKLSFKSLDATNYVSSGQDTPDLVLLNPPRRGAGLSLMTYLQQLKPNYILYSSCNLLSLVDDLKVLPNYQIHKVQLFDMFPHTSHMEVLLLLKNIQE